MTDVSPFGSALLAARVDKLERRVADLEAAAAAQALGQANAREIIGSVMERIEKSPPANGSAPAVAALRVIEGGQIG